MLFMWMLRFKVSIQDIPLKQIVIFTSFSYAKTILVISLLSFVENFPLLFILESKNLYFYFLNSSLFDMRIFVFWGEGERGTCTGTRTHVGVGRLVKSQRSEPLYQPCPWNNKIRIIHASVFSQIKTNDAIGSSVFTHTLLGNLYYANSQNINLVQSTFQSPDASSKGDYSNWYRPSVRLFRIGFQMMTCS